MARRAPGEGLFSSIGIRKLESTSIKFRSRLEDGSQKQYRVKSQEEGRDLLRNFSGIFSKERFDWP